MPEGDNSEVAVADEHRNVSISAGTIRLIIEIVTTALLVSGWGWSIKMQVAVQDIKLEQAARDAAMARVQVEELWKAMADGRVNIIRRREPPQGDHEP